ncbi:D-tyrosyl-tRNA(Tyr) deacylase [Ruminiclostridium sufflavum DSM 19573]|uniref:D-aminoacyl-tRNA deacylase n=1 Tax=Ruminiclostridium sufflavum DSM 19573 TaxID=1121337 RepID=A0A318Y602_9FIRM|nr:D-aminoacyl-tRNA deacylase [Ruminiclostridium sufflavum]PYG87420.1 D-tyrosyl-tRNA(Tyr) deacylase [Ruminiclostridium sufflavum DSM 19573]
MRAVVQRVKKSKVTVDENITGEIGKGLMVLLGVGLEDSFSDADYLAEKILKLRIFEDDNEKMNKSLLDAGGEILVISQFTLYGDCRKGKRPSFDKAARPDKAKELYEYFVNKCEEYGITAQTGIFQAHMLVDISNDGPVTLLLDSRREF